MTGADMDNAVVDQPRAGRTDTPLAGRQPLDLPATDHSDVPPTALVIADHQSDDSPRQTPGGESPTACA